MEKHRNQVQISLPKSSRKRSNEWIFRDVPSDITIEVNGGIFALHKFPLVSRSGRIRKLVAGHRDSDISKVELLNLPGGTESFELAAKFCYGINFEITSANVAQLCCASEYLEMTEDYSKENLFRRAQEYLDSVVCKSLEHCVEVLQQCENLVPLADELKIVSRCIDSIASKACAEQIASSFSRLEYSSSGRLQMNRQAKSEGDWWIADLSVLRIDLYQRVLIAMKCRGVRPESIGVSLMNYAQKELAKKPSLWNPSTKLDPSLGSSHHEKLVVETIVSLLPVEKLVIPISFLFGLLRSAVMLDCAISCRLDLERRIGSQLDIATLDDLLIPSFRHPGDTLFDVDIVHRILVNFSQQDQSEDDMDNGSVFESECPCSPSQTSLFKVAKLVDNYLAEIAPDANLKLAKFLVIAEALPGHARTIHDGLYRAIDIYLKAHQGLSDSDKKKLSKLIDFQKLSQEAGAHAAQNERLPLQSIVQVLYFEQLRLRTALACSNGDEDQRPPHQPWRVNSGALSAAMSPRDNYASLRRENRELKLELARLRMRLNDLEKEHVCMKRDMQRSHSRRFITSFSKKLGRLSLFGHNHSQGSTSPSKQSFRTDSKSDKYFKLKLSGFEKLHGLQIVVAEELYYRNVIKRFGIVSKKRYECNCLLQNQVSLRSRQAFILNSQKVEELPIGESVWSFESVSSLTDNESSALINEQSTQTAPKSRGEESTPSWPPVNWKDAPDFEFARNNGFRIQPAASQPNSGSRKGKKDCSVGLNEHIHTAVPINMDASFVTGNRWNPTSDGSRFGFASGPSAVNSNHAVGVPEYSSSEFNERDQIYTRAPSTMQAIQTGRVGEEIAFNIFEGNLVKGDDKWNLSVISIKYNLEAIKYAQGHLQWSKLKQKEKELVDVLIVNRTTLRQIFGALKKDDPENASNICHVYNHRQRTKMVKNGGNPQMQCLLAKLQLHKYNY